MSATVEVWILNNCLEPLCNPTDAEDITITWNNGGTAVCSLENPEEFIRSWETIGNGSWHAAMATDDLTGKTYITGSPMCGSGFGGKHSIGRHRLMVERNSFVFPQPIVCVPIDVRSPDIDLDGAVNLADLALFGDYYNSACGDFIGDYMCHRCDLNASGSVNLADYALLSAHYDHNCGDCPRSVGTGCNY
ncbi:MAG: dockerin type I repeat-containing protein [Candidatus Latescibacteria bacterium]|nr:dockerin type I repeat-containing protein [Candidatus Latescibacterota bacterium]